MEATKMLMEEHRVIERVLASLEAGARRLQADQSVRPEFFIQASDFVKGFADGCHHRKEESVLFPAMEAVGVAREGGPIGVMLAEHEEGRRLNREMRAGAERMRAGDSDARAEVARNSLAYVLLMRQHIMKEEKVLFLMADRAILGDRETEVAEAFERVEREETAAGAHEKYLALAEALEGEAKE